MIKVKASSAKGKNLLARAQYFRGTDLSDVYESWSSAKAQAMKECRQWCKQENGENFRIISANGWSFSVAWETEEGTRIETSTNSYLVIKED